MSLLWVFDNDGTLYDDRPIQAPFHLLLTQYMKNQLAVEESAITELLTTLKHKWETSFSLIALMHEYGLDFTELMAATYMAVPLASCGVCNDPQRRQVLTELAGDKIVLTNNPAPYAERVVTLLGVRDCFQGIIGMEDLKYKGKPHPQAYAIVMDRYPGYAQYRLCDDLIVNLDAAREAGWDTVWCPLDVSGAMDSNGHKLIHKFEELAGMN